MVNISITFPMENNVQWVYLIEYYNAINNISTDE